MERRVASLPPEITSRFGEVVFAQGGAGYGWWPSLIFDPRLTVEPARSQARKHLGTRHLVYFFQCVDAPFSVLPVKQIKPWIEGLSEDMHLGRAAKSHGKQRYKCFQEALEVACLEMDKPADERLDWDHTDPSQQQQQNTDNNQSQPLSRSPSPLKQQQRIAVAPVERGKKRKKGTLRRSLVQTAAVSRSIRQMGSDFRRIGDPAPEQQSTSSSSDPNVAASLGRSDPTEWTVRRRKSRRRNSGQLQGRDHAAYSNEFVDE